MRTYTYKLTAYGISDARQRELRAFCEQYDEKLQKLRDLYSLSSPPFDAPVQGGLPSDPTLQKAAKAQKLRSDVDLIDRCLLEAAYGSQKGADDLKRNVIYRQGEHSWGNVSCGKNTMYRWRTRFFVLLDHALNEREG